MAVAVEKTGVCIPVLHIFVALHAIFAVLVRVGDALHALVCIGTSSLDVADLAVAV